LTPNFIPRIDANGSSFAPPSDSLSGREEKRRSFGGQAANKEFEFECFGSSVHRSSVDRGILRRRLSPLRHRCRLTAKLALSCRLGTTTTSVAIGKSSRKSLRQWRLRFMACLDSRFGDGLSPISVCVFVGTVAAEEHHDRQSYSGQSCQNARIRTLYSRAFASIRGLDSSVHSRFKIQRRFVV